MTEAAVQTSQSALGALPARLVGSLRLLRDLLPSGPLLAVVLAAGAALVAGSLADFGVSGRGLVGAVLCPALVVLASIDLRHRTVPTLVALTASLAVALVVLAGDPRSFPAHLAAGAALGGFFLAFAVLIPGSMDLGDAKLGFLLGLALAARTFSAMMVAFATLLLAALVVLFRRGLGARKETLPFTPFLALGGILGFFLG